MDGQNKLYIVSRSFVATVHTESGVPLLLCLDISYLLGDSQKLSGNHVGQRDLLRALDRYPHTVRMACHPQVTLARPDQRARAVDCS